MGRCGFTPAVKRAATHAVQPKVRQVIAEEERAGLASMEGYESFGRQVKQTKLALLDFLVKAAREGKSVAGYGAPGKSATLLHYCGIGRDLIEYTVDRSPHKQGRFLPGTHIPIYHPDRIRETKPDYVVILPWNLKERNHEAVAVHTGMGRAFRRPHSNSGDRLEAKAEVIGMKVVLFCGGAGMRLRGYADDVPKPMVQIGNRPILWHLMKYYAHFGHKDFILCLGHKGNGIKDYFLHYDESVSNDFVWSQGGKKIHFLNRDIDDWTITFVETGANATIGERLKAVEPYLEGEEMFLANYGDGLSDLPLPSMLETFRESNAIASLLLVQPREFRHREH